MLQTNISIFLKVIQLLYQKGQKYISYQGPQEKWLLWITTIPNMLEWIFQDGLILMHGGI